MSAWKITPSTAHTVTPSTPISECVRVMREHSFGSILVVDHTGELTGIFTERDLLKWIDEIQHGGHWDKPVALLMSRPVFTLSIDELDRVPEIMIEQNIRHVPIMHIDSSGQQTLAGIVSMRDLLREMEVTKRAAPAAPQGTLRAGMITQQEGIKHLIRRVCARRGSIALENVPLSPEVTTTLEQTKDLDYLFFDLDQTETKTWISLLKAINGMEKHPNVVLFYDPKLHPETALDLLSKLSLSKNFSAYMKPVSVFSLLSRLS